MSLTKVSRGMSCKTFFARIDVSSFTSRFTSAKESTDTSAPFTSSVTSALPQKSSTISQKLEMRPTNTEMQIYF